MEAVTLGDTQSDAQALFDIVADSLLELKAES